MTYMWTPTGAEEAKETAEHREVHKRWEAECREQHRADVVQRDTYAGQLLTREGWGQRLLHQSRLIRPWSELEERRWLQMAGRVYPVMSYLRRIDKHPTGECPWCGGGEIETLAHFQSQCGQFTANRTAAHNDIARATLAALKDMRLPNWRFYYETTLDELPFKFKWADAAEEEEQCKRRPDGVAWNEVEGRVVFLEFTRAMDNPDNIRDALEAKGVQYAAAERALERAQRRASSTSPLPPSSSEYGGLCCWTRRGRR